MAVDPIPNDDLGEWGESQFRALCSAASLVANKAERDKMGWDFLVELPPEPSGDILPLDQRPNGLRCRVQVKTHWRRQDDRFEMTLSAAERLAKDPGPSFVVVLTAERGTGDDDPRLVDCHLVHLLDDNLERVLRRLRESAADPQAGSLVEQKISYSSSLAGEQLTPTGKALREALVGICGSDPQTYVANKGEQLKTLGYTTGRYKVEATIEANNMDEFVEIMLGLRPTTVENVETYDTRFNVFVPVDHTPPEGTTTQWLVQPHPADTCSIRVRGKGLTPLAVFRGEVFIPVLPSIPVEYRRTLIKAPFFSLDVRAGGRLNFSLSAEELSETDMILEDWRNYLRLFEILGEDEVEFEIQGSRPESPHVTLRTRSNRLFPQEPWFAQLSDVVRRGEALLNAAGASGGATSLSKLSETADSIHRAHAYLFEPATIPPQTFQTSGPLTVGEAPSDVDFLLVGYLIVAGVALAYASRLTLRPEPMGNGLVWRQIDLKPEKLAVIEKTVEASKRFVAAVQDQTGLRNSIVLELDLEAEENQQKPM